ncbi:MAG TPA: gluconate 2-dehydrogenase subunit 3 family protein [Vicinamibacterales bacterium]
MRPQQRSRRQFLIQSVAGLGGAWVAANYAGIMEAQAFVQQATSSGQPIKLAFFTEAQAAEVDAMAAQIIPSDATPGAREAHVINFIDRALVTFEKNQQQAYVKGLQDLDAQTKTLFPGAARFSALTSEQQIQVLTAMEKTPFFNLVRTHTVTGFFASPIHGGNYDKVGWKLVNYDDSLNHKPPFGYYDAQPLPRR